jgi:hypothetical protein
VSGSLFDAVHGLLTRTYGLAPLDRPGRFVLGDARYRDRHGPLTGPRLLVEHTRDDLKLGVYLPDAMIHQLERFPPQHGLHEKNIEPFAALVEELDHLITLVHRWRCGRKVSRFELELQANVSKHLVLTRYLAGTKKRLSEGRRAWLYANLFGRVQYTEPNPAARTRYRDAARYAVRFLRGFALTSARHRLRVLRRFHHGSVNGKLNLIERLANP